MRGGDSVGLHVTCASEGIGTSTITRQAVFFVDADDCSEALYIATVFLRCMIEDAIGMSFRSWRAIVFASWRAFVLPDLPPNA